jgi:hypothetical protein
MRVFWDIMPCSPVGVDRRFRRAYCVHYQGGDDGNSTHSETSVYSSETTTIRRLIPENSHIYFASVTKAI